VEKDLTEAFGWYLKSAKQGYAQAQFRVGMCYKDGSGVGVDLVEAIHWINKASEQGGIYEYVYPEVKNILKDAVGTPKAPEQDKTQAFEELKLKEAQEKLFKDLKGAQHDTEKKIAELKKVQHDTDNKIVEFENEKATIIENAKKEVEKHGQFYLTVFTGVSIAITLAFIAIMFSYLTSSLEGIKETIQAQAGSPQIKIERIQALQKEVESLKAKLTVLEEKNTKPTPTQKH
jgi:hypothetical protein